MNTVLKVLGVLVLVFATGFVTFLGWLATKGLVTAKGMILDLPAQGRITPIPIGMLLSIVLFMLILGVVLLKLGKRTPQTPNQDGISQSERRVNP